MYMNIRFVKVELGSLTVQETSLMLTTEMFFYHIKSIRSVHQPIRTKADMWLCRFLLLFLVPMALTVTQKLTQIKEWIRNRPVEVMTGSIFACFFRASMHSSFDM